MRKIKFASVFILLSLILNSIPVNCEKVTKIWINELMYYQDKDGTEWIEFYNPNNLSIDLSGWIISDDPNPTSPGREGVCRFPNGSFISARSYLVIALNGSLFYRKYGFYPNFEIEDSDPSIKDLIIESSGFKLSDNGDDVHLFDIGLNEIDRVWYGDGGDLDKNGSAPTTSRGSSLSRYRYTGTPSEDFMEDKDPTPGRENNRLVVPRLEILIYPEFLPKIERDKDFSMTFLFKVSLSNLSYSDHWKMKAFVSSVNDSRYVSTQTWNGERWVYSYYYTFEGYGNYSGWIALRFFKEYKDYKDIEKGRDAYLYVKCVLDDNDLIDCKKVHLLDIDNSTSNATKGGIVFGRVDEENKIVLLKDDYITVSVSLTEERGFFKMYAPIGKRLSLVDEGGKILKEDLFARRGRFDFNAWIDGDKLWIENSGDFPENITIEDRTTLLLYPGEVKEVDIDLLNAGDEIHIYLIEDPTISRYIKLSHKEYGENLSIDWIEIVGENDTNLEEGKVYMIKAKIDNRGDCELKNVRVAFYIDEILLGYRDYETLGKYPKYPSIELDTSGLIGEHKIRVGVYAWNHTLDRSISVNIFKGSYMENVLITRAFCYGFSWFNGEFIEMYNPSDKIIDISGWYITDRPNERVDRQPKIMFPNGTTIEPRSYVIISSNSSAHINLFGKYPDLEYQSDIPDVENMIEIGHVVFNNIGDVIVLKDKYNRTIDALVYGKSIDLKGWKDDPVRSPKKGELFERKSVDGSYLDTNTSSDWKITKLGRSNYRVMRFSGEMEMIGAVSPDCSLNVLLDELSKANESVVINSYLFSNPYITKCLIDLLKRGVRVCILVEGQPVGGIQNKEMLCILKNAGAEIYKMTSKGDYRRYRFDHAKYCIIDNISLIVGSANFDQNGYTMGNKGNREWIVVVKNESIAKFFYDVFRDDLEKPDVSVFNLTEQYQDKIVLPEGSCISRFSPIRIKEDVKIYPILSPDNSEDLLIEILRGAKESIYIEQMMFDPYDLDTLTRELINASGRGIDVKVIVNSRYVDRDKILILRDHNIDIKLFDPSDYDLENLHVKGLIVDNCTVVVSSINFDYNSIYENREVGLVIESRDLAMYFADIFFYDWYGDSRHMEDYKNVFLLILIFGTAILVILMNWKR